MKAVIPQRPPQPLSSTTFMRSIPKALRLKLPPPLRAFRWQARSYLVQVYYNQPEIHFEVWSIRRLGRLEMVLHFESRDRAFNERMSPSSTDMSSR